MRPEPYLHFQDDRVFDALEAFENGPPSADVPAALAIAWLLAHPKVTAVVVGPRRPEQLQPALEALDLELSLSEREPGRALRMSVLVLPEQDVRRLLPMEECIEAMTSVLALTRPRRAAPAAPFVTRPPGAGRLMGLMPAHRGGDAGVVAEGDRDRARQLRARARRPPGRRAPPRRRDGRAAGDPERVADHRDPHRRRLGGGDAGARATGRADASRSWAPACRRARMPRRCARSWASSEIRMWSRRDGGDRRGGSCGAPTSSARARARASRCSAASGSRRARTSTPSARACRPRRELDAETVAAAALFVDRRESTLNESGDSAARRAGRRADRGRARRGADRRAPRAHRPDELTVFKSLGLAVEDLAAAELVVAQGPRAGRRHRGRVLIPLAEIERARETIAGAAIRTPLVRLHGRRAGRDLAQAREPPADRLVQDPRRRQRDPAGVARRDAPRASSPRAPATWRRASRGRRASSACRRRSSCPETRPQTKLAAIERLGGTRRQGAVRASGGRSCVDSQLHGADGLLRPPSAGRARHGRQRHDRARDRRGPSRRRRGARAVGRRRSLHAGSRARSRRSGRRRRSTRSSRTRARR